MKSSIPKILGLSVSVFVWTIFVIMIASFATESPNSSTSNFTYYFILLIAEIIPIAVALIYRHSKSKTSKKLFKNSTDTWIFFLPFIIGGGVAILFPALLIFSGM